MQIKQVEMETIKLLPILDFLGKLKNWKIAWQPKGISIIKPASLGMKYLSLKRFISEACDRSHANKGENIQSNETPNIRLKDFDQRMDPELFNPEKNRQRSIGIKRKSNVPNPS